jgi:hypothetical protein
MFAVTDAAGNLSVVLACGQFKWIKHAEEFDDRKAKLVFSLFSSSISSFIYLQFGENIRLSPV